MPDARIGQPLVSVIVVTLNNGAMLRTCLESLGRQTYSPVEVIVVDNGSSEDIAAIVASVLPSAIVIRLEQNTGFAGGNNRGIRQSTGTYIALLNNDAVAEPGWIASLVATAEQDPRLGAVGSLIIDGNAPDRLDSFGVGVSLDGMSRQKLHGAPLSSPEIRSRDVLAVSGCACLFRAEALREAGLFDERFFAYCEDTDASLRLVRAGWRLVVEPGARVTHYYSRTGGAFSLRKVFWVERNHFWVAVKNFPAALVVILPLLTVWRWVLQTVAVVRKIPGMRQFSQEHGLCRLLCTTAAADMAALAGIPAMVRRRMAFRPVQRVGGCAFMRTLWRQRMPLFEAVTGMGRDRFSTPPPGGSPDP